MTLFESATGLLSQVVHYLLLASFGLAFAFHVGWVNRLMVWSMERELSKILNKTPVTVGSLKVDLFRGRGWASNVVLHSPRRDTWKWQSPVLARIGKLYVECNLVACLLSLWFLWEERPLDVFTVEVSDVQGFVERKHNVFNFYLLDPHIDVPDPVDDEDDDEEEFEEEVDDDDDDEAMDDGGALEDSGDFDDVVDDEEGVAKVRRRGSHRSTTPSSAAGGGGILEGGDDDDETDNNNDNEDPHASAAQQLVDDMVRALGRAALRGSFHSALVESRARLKTELQALQARKSKTEAMQEGVKLVQRVSQSLVEKSQAVPSLVVPNRKRNGPKDKIVYGRVGRVVLQDLRVFTRDHGFDDALPGTTTKKKQQRRRRSSPSMSRTNHANDVSLMSAARGGGWNKPIYLDKVVLRAAELCPSLSAKDDQNPHLPAVYQRLDRCFEIIWKRVLTEIAKSNTGAFIQTAMGEVLDYYMEPPAATVWAPAGAAPSNGDHHRGGGGE